MTLKLTVGYFYGTEANMMRPVEMIIEQKLEEEMTIEQKLEEE